MRGCSRVASVVVACIALIPTAASAQGSIAGVVRDTSGAVLPGVTVEASSPALIEKTRSVVTDGAGQYRVVDLRPGTYTVTFSLTGFNTVKRDGLDLTGSFTATVNAEMRVGALEETITVTGVTPTVDVQSATRQRVLDQSVIEAIPASRVPYALAALIPGVTSTQLSGAGFQDVGGSLGFMSVTRLTVHGSKNDSQRITQNGISLSTIVTGQSSAGAFNMAAIQEVTIDYSAISAELGQGGVQMNIIPREGGNVFKGLVFGSFANSAMQGSNLTQELKDRGLTAPDSIKKNWDINPGFGGPITKDRLWFFASARYSGAQNYAAGMFYNVNANNPNAWTYVADPSRPASNDFNWTDGQLRLTWQVTPKNKFAVSYDQQDQCQCTVGVGPTLSPEASQRATWPLQRIVQADWTSPATNRLLLEASVLQRGERIVADPQPGFNPLMISVTDQANGLTYRARPSYNNHWTGNLYYRAALSYITGGHAFKVGFNDGSGTFRRRFYDLQPISYRFNNGVPNQIAINATPYGATTDMDHDIGLYAQDRWTHRRLTATLGVRYDYFASSFPDQHLGPARLTPTRDLAYPGRSNLSWHDITPKMGASYDLFGTGKTAVKVTLNKYLAGQGAAGIADTANPVNRLVLSTTRAWTDANRDFAPDCDLLNPAANGECGAMANANFGRPVPGATFDPAVISGWGRRGFNWEFSTGVQREVLPRVALDVGYFRRWFGNFTVTDNLTLAPSDYNPYSITAPVDPRLPGGGGYVISGLYDLNPAKFGQPANNYVTFTDSYGTQIEHWNGLDVTLNARPGPGLLFQGGISSGRTVTDNCDVVSKVDNPSRLYCHQQTPFLTQVKVLGAYIIPRVDVQISGALQSIAGPALAANYNAPNALIASSLGRNLAGGAANATINLVTPATMYGDRLNQLDLRFAKFLTFSRTRTALNLDLYNALNANPVLTENSNYAVWRRPTSILVARFLKVSAQFDF